MQEALDVTRNEHRLIARFAMPEHGEWAGHWFTEMGWLVGEDLPLTGGADAQERSHSLRIITEYLWQEGQAGHVVAVQRGT